MSGSDFDAGTKFQNPPSGRVVPLCDRVHRFTIPKSSRLQLSDARDEQALTVLNGEYAREITRSAIAGSVRPYRA